MITNKHVFSVLNPFSRILYTTFSSNFQPLTVNTNTHNQNFHQLLHVLNLLKTKTNPNFISLQTVHSLVLKLGALSDPRTSTSLIISYAKCHNFLSSWNLFEEIPLRDKISWNAMITASVHHQHLQLALDLFHQMRVDEKIGFDSTTLLLLVSAVSRIKDLKQGQILHCLSFKVGDLGSNCYLCNALVDMYAKCGNLSSAELVFEGMQYRDVSSWNSVISGCLHNGCGDKSLWYFKKMGVEAEVLADDLTLSCSISACSFLGELDIGQAIHGVGIKLGYGENINISVANALITFYSQCGEINSSDLVFRDMMLKEDVVSWNSMIHVFAENGMFSEAIACLHDMQFKWDVQPDSATLLSILQLCGDSKLLSEGNCVHGFIIRRERERDLTLTNSMMDMYSKCNRIVYAEALFRKISRERDIISWNTMIAGYSQNDSSEEAQVVFRELLCSGTPCSISTVLAILPSCDSPEHLWFGKSLHGWQFKLGFSNYVLANNSLMFMYINSADVISSFLLLDEISAVADVISWNTLIVGCMHNGHLHEALAAFNRMRHDSLINPDSITIVSILAVCGHLKLQGIGRFLHGLTLRKPLGSDVRVSNALITMYSRCEDIMSATSVFSTSPYHNLCSWNSMISGFAQNKEGRRALELFHHLEFEPNEFTIVSILSASTQLGVLEHGKQIHGYVFRFGLVGNPFILASLVDMYSKCGRLDIAIQIFNESKEKSIASWNSMISAFGFHGYGRKSIQLFTEMCESDISPTKSTFVSLLSACSHSGLVEEGQLYYKLMSAEFGVEPTIEHHICVVDMLGRHGRLDEAYEFVKSLPSLPETSIWGALLSACRYHGDPKMAKQVAEHLFNMEPGNVGYYVSLFNTYVAAGMWDDAGEIRKMIEERKLTKAPGYSLIEFFPG